MSGVWGQKGCESQSAEERVVQGLDRMIVKVHHTKNGTLVAICDSELLGKRFSEGENEINLTGDFFNGEEMNEDQAGDLLRNCYTFNLVGEKSINLGLKEEVIVEDDVKLVAGIPYAQGVLIKEE